MDWFLYDNSVRHKRVKETFVLWQNKLQVLQGHVISHRVGNFSLLLTDIYKLFLCAFWKIPYIALCR